MKRISRAIAVTATALAVTAGLAVIPVTSASAAVPLVNCSGDALIEKSFDNGTDWQMCWRVDSKHGLVLEQVAVRAPGEDAFRRVLDSVSLGQLNVPYDTGKNVWNDITSYGFGNQYLQKLSAAECSTGTLRDYGQAWSVTRRGVTTNYLRTIPSLCITDTTRDMSYRSHEQTWGSIEDKPLFTATGQAFNLTIVSKVDWYEYATKVEFTDEGAISFNLGATGDISYEDFDADATTGWPVGTDAANYAASHWHNAFWRLDFGLDGQSLQQVEQYDSTLGEPGEMAPLMHTTGATIEHPANLVPAADTTWWRVVAPESRNADNHARSYEFVFPGSQLYQGNPITQPLISVTNYADCEQFASNNLNPACPNLSVLDYVANSADAALTDPVAWVNSGFHHVVRDEDQSPMQTHWQSFSIMPRDWTAQSMSTPDARTCINGDTGGEIHSDETPCEAVVPTEPEPTDPPATEPPTTTEPPTPTDPADPGEAEPTLTLSTTELIPGESFELEGAGFAADESVEVVLHSDPITVGALTADGSGTVSGALKVPTGAPEGSHTVVVTGTESGLTAKVGVTVAAAAGTAGAGAGLLASTGTALPIAAATVALVLLAAGALLVIRRRRRSAISAI
ncbi:LPXTG cell wall anchor domain-containing protein [Agromyces aureus]|uniref:Amine oxidase n=1 Tax=Agromyces aureus TaxID=453304 RepID=A0A191WBD9_9MICO|nr:LPXTG cell wall anchor domain-containing protein [Agromyces aureus]ANJ25557.1 hypothetical protein ATC03_00980 [Agromyces aureus]